MEHAFSETTIDTQGTASVSAFTPTSVRMRPVPVTDDQFAHGLIRAQAFLPSSELLTKPPQRSWLAVARALRTQGTGADSRFVPMPGVNPEMALRHVGALLRTPTLTAEQRDQSIGLLLAHWFVAVILEDGPSAGRPA